MSIVPQRDGSYHRPIWCVRYDHLPFRKHLVLCSERNMVTEGEMRDRWHWGTLRKPRTISFYNCCKYCKGRGPPFVLGLLSRSRVPGLGCLLLVARLTLSATEKAGSPRSRWPSTDMGWSGTKMRLGTPPLPVQSCAQNERTTHGLLAYQFLTWLVHLPGGAMERRVTWLSGAEHKLGVFSGCKIASSSQFGSGGKHKTHLSPPGMLWHLRLEKDRLGHGQMVMVMVLWHVSNVCLSRSSLWSLPIANQRHPRTLRSYKRWKFLRAACVWSLADWFAPFAPDAVKVPP